MIMGCERKQKEAGGWLEALMREKFFEGCSYHENAKKNEKNVCCLDCCTSICPHCLPSHRFHSLLQIRRYVYHDVVRLQDLHKLFDCSNVQAYTINSAKVVFIKKRPQNRQFKGSGNYCTSCDRSLQEPFIHCSLSCKVDFVLKHNKDLSPYLRPCNTLQLSPDFLIPQDHMIMAMGDQEDNDMTRFTIVDSDEPISSNSSSVSSGSDHNNMIITSTIIHNNNNNAYNYEDNNIVRKKRSTNGWNNVCARLMSSAINNSSNKVSDDEDIATSTSRRKGIPHRSPFC